MLLIKCILIFGVFNTTMSYERRVSSIIKDFLEMKQTPSKIFAFLCWPDSEKEHFLKTLIQHPVSITSLDGDIYPHQPINHQLFLLDANCKGYDKILEEAQKQRLFRLPYRWIIIFNNDTHISKDLDILIDSEFVLIREEFHDSFRLKSIYKLSKYHREFLENDIAVWNGGFQYFKHLSATRNRSNLYGLTMNISYVILDVDSLNHLWDYRDTHIDSISKLNFLLTHHLLRTLNATTNFTQRNTWGYLNRTTGIYSGMVGDLQLGYAELGGTAAFFTVDRVDVIEYIAPTTPTRATFIFRAPPLSYVTNVFTLPFSKAVWYASFLLLGLISIVIHLIAKWEWDDEEFSKTLEKKHNILQPNFFDVLVLELGAICQQGSEAEPKSGSGRIATLFVFVALMFMYTSYSANIVALLQSTSDSINSVEDLLHSRIKLGVENTPYSRYYFQVATDPIRKAVYEQKISPKSTLSNFMDMQAGITKMRQEFFAFHCETSQGYKVISETFQEHEKCGLKTIEIWQVIDPWIAVKKNTSYMELFKVGFRKLQETGIQNREYRRLYTKKPVCQGTGNNFMSVGLIDCYYAFLIFGIGAVVSLILLIIEKFVYQKGQSNEKSLEFKNCLERKCSCAESNH